MKAFSNNKREKFCIARYLKAKPSLLCDLLLDPVIILDQACDP